MTKERVLNTPESNRKRVKEQKDDKMPSTKTGSHVKSRRTQEAKGKKYSNRTPKIDSEDF